MRPVAPLLLVSILFILAGATSPGFSEGAASSLAPPGLPFPGGWDRAVARWNLGQAWKPSRMTIKSEELSAEGRVVSVEESILALSYPEGPDKPRTELVRATKDGVDVTADRRKSARGGGQSGPPGGMDFPDPFPFGKSADKVLLALASATPRGYEEYSYRIPGKTTVVGRLRFSAGEIHAIEYSLEPLPIYLRAFSAEVIFAAAPDASLVAKELSFDAEASFLVVKKHFRVTMSFSDWAVVALARK